MKKNRNRGFSLRKKFKPFLLKMKVTLFLTLFCLLQSFAGVYSQVAKFDLSVEHFTLEQVIKVIEKKVEYRFLYSIPDVDKVKDLSIHVRDADLKTILDLCLQGTGLSYEIEDKVIIIQQKPVPPQQKEYRITGKVLDHRGTPLPGVTIRVDGTALGTVSRPDGTFSLGLPLEKGCLIFTFVGFKQKRQPFEAGKELKIVLEEDVTDLDEVVVRAYGTQNKREMISAISSVKAEEMKELPAASVISMLQGRLAGVNIINQSGAPGSAASVTVRGFNSLMDGNSDAGGSDGQPLFVVDGVPMHSFISPVTGTNTLADLDPSMIESVEVLKDAAASSIYGSRAGNGVILITTKKGVVGRSSFAANVSYSLSQLMEYPLQTGGRLERWMDIQLKRNQRATYSVGNSKYYPTSYEDVYGTYYGVYDAFWGNGNRSTPYKNEVLQDSLNPFYNHATNWWKYAFRTGKVFSGNIQASGGSDKFQYMIGAGYYDETGIMLNSSYARANLISNMTVHPTEQLRIDSRVYMAYVDRSMNTGGISNGRYEGLTVNPSSKNTVEGLMDGVKERWLQAINQTVVRSDDYRAIVSLSLNYRFWKGLHFSASGSVDYSQANLNRFSPSTLDALRKENTSTGSIGRMISLTTEELLRYKISFKEDHHMEALLGFNANKVQNFGISGHGRRGASDDVYWYDAKKNPSVHDYGTPEFPFVESLTTYSSHFREKIMLSYFGRIGYHYKQRYLLEFTFRRDGSSTFGENNQWANFPSIAAGWAFSEESFMQWARWLDWGKIRGSYGTSGQIFTDEYLAHGLVGQDNSTRFLGNPGVISYSYISPDLTWEKSEQYDIGLDLDLFNYRIGLKLDYYYKLTSGLIYNVPLPGDIYGMSERTENAMEVSNEGIELELTADIFRDREFCWRTKLNVSRNWNRFKKSYDHQDKGSLVIGRPLYQMMVYEDDGYYQSDSEVPYFYRPNGEPVYLGNHVAIDGISGKVGAYNLKDLNGDGNIYGSDMVAAGSPLTLAHGGWVHELKWKGLELNLLFNYSIGRKIINQRTATSLNYVGPKFLDLYKAKFWEKPGDNTELPRLGEIIITSRRSAIENVNHLSLKQLTIGYDLPKLLANKMCFSGIRFFLTGENLFYLTNYSGGNPEVVNVYTGQDDGMQYPLPRKWTLGLTLKF